jgi:methyl-accepting chemotaxis protein
MASQQPLEPTINDQRLEQMRVLNVVLLVILVIALLGALILTISEIITPAGEVGTIVLIATMAVAAFVLWRINNLERVQTVSIVMVLTLFAVYIPILHITGGYASTSAVSLTFFPVLMVIILEKRIYIRMTTLFVLLFVALAAGETFVPGLKQPPPAPRDVNNAIFNVMVVITTAALLNWIVSRLNETRASSAAQVKRLDALNQQMQTQQQMQSHAATEVQAAAQRIDSAITEQAASAQEQAATVSQVSSSAEQLGMEAQLIAGSAGAVSELARQAKEEVEVSKRLISELDKAMQLVHTDVSLAVARTAELGEHTREVRTLLQLLESISKETHILSLNAAIEAASAEDTTLGRRFTVVAQEVEELAGRADRATLQARTIIGQIDQASNSTAIATVESMAETERSVKLLAEATDAVRKLSAMAADVNIWADSIMQSTEQQRTSSEQVAEALRQISSIAHQNAISEQQLQAVADQLTALVGKMQVTVGASVEGSVASTMSSDGGAGQVGALTTLVPRPMR